MNIKQMIKDIEVYVDEQSKLIHKIRTGNSINLEKNLKRSNLN